MGNWVKLVAVIAAIALVLGLVFVKLSNDRYAENAERSVNAETIIEQVKDSDDSISSASNIAELDVSSDRASNVVDFSLIVLSPADEKAVILDKEGKTVLVTVGDTVGSLGLEVLQITTNKLVTKNPKTGSTIWVFELEGDKKGRVQEFSSTLPQSAQPTSSTPDTSNIGLTPSKDK